MPIGVYTRSTKLEDWDPLNNTRPATKNRLRKTKAFLSPNDVGQGKAEEAVSASTGGVFELADTGVGSRTSMDPSMHDDSSSDDDSFEDG